MFDPAEQAKLLREFLARHVRPYDPGTDDYDRPPFAADIKEGKNDPIYNAHSYHTKVPPRSIIPYILHYTQPGDLVLDPFCGSGMTGVAAQMCANPPADILEQFPELKDRIGPRACILNDLSPAACHIAYNYNTPVDVAALKREFERIKAVVKDEFDWLYGTEHYEPAVGLYEPASADVVCRLKNPPLEPEATSKIGQMLLEGHTHYGKQDWELLAKAEVETRLGYPVTELPRDDNWGRLDVANVEQWICIPATIQYTIWSDIYRCEGFVTIEEPTGKISKRGKNAGNPTMNKRSVARGCGQELRLWDVGFDREAKEVRAVFQCPHCNQDWTTENATLLRTAPNEIIYAWEGFKAHCRERIGVIRCQRTLSHRDRQRLAHIESSKTKHWYPSNNLVPGEQGNPFLNRGINTVDRFWTLRNLAALARLWSEFESVSDSRIRQALQFLFTSVSVGICSRMTRYNFGKRGNGAMAMRLFFPHFQAEANVLKVLAGKLDDVAGYYSANRVLGLLTRVITSPAQELNFMPDKSVDFIFTDPPFGRNIAYAELNILWEAWLGRMTDVPKEAITSSGRKWDVASYAAKMRSAFVEMFRVLKPGRYALVEFNNSDPELRLFEQIKLAAIDAGFDIRSMAILDKEHKSYNQVVGSIRGEDTVDKDVIFNLRKPSTVSCLQAGEDQDLAQQVADAVREHLQNLPDRIKADPAKYNDDYRTTSTIHSMLMNTLIPRGVSVERINLPAIERLCARYFRKVGQRWYLRGEAVGGNGGGLIQEEIAIKDEETAIAWLRQKLEAHPAPIGELKPLWMKATGLLSASVCQGLVLEDLLIPNFWRDERSNRWREPTEAERERMNDDKTIRVLHDAERYVAGSLRRQTSDMERCEWIDALFKMCRALEENDSNVLPSIRELAPDEGYRLIGRLFQGILNDRIPPAVYSRAAKQSAVASQRIVKDVEEQAQKAKVKRREEEGPTLFDL